MHRGYRFGVFRLDLATLTLSRNGTAIDLRPKAFDTLRVLVERAGSVVTKDDLVAVVWPDVIVNDDALSQCIRDVRQALGEEGRDFIRTVPKRGYIFEAPVDAITKAPDRARTPIGRLVALMMILGILAGAATWILRTETTTGRQITIAVLPFATVGPDEEKVWLGEGIAEDIMVELSRFTDLAVIARNSSFRFPPDLESPKALADQIHADYVLQGSIRRSGQRIRLAVQLVDSKDWRNVWAEQFEEPYADVSALPREVAGEIAGRLAANVASDAASSAARRKGSTDAFEATLQARHLFYQFTRDAAYQGLDAVERALRLDPDNATAWEFKARLLLQFYVMPYDDRRGDPAVLDVALDAARRAVRLSPKSSSAVASLGDVYSWTGDHETGLQHLKRAIELNPNNSEAIKRFADALGRAGQHAESLAAWEDGSRLDPIFVPLNYALIGRSHLMLGNAERALELTGDCLELTPDMLPCHIFRALSAEAAGQREIVAEEVRKVERLAPGFTVDSWLSIVGIRDEPTLERLRHLAIAAGLRP